MTNLAIQLMQMPRGLMKMKHVLAWFVVQFPGGRQCLAARHAILKKLGRGRSQAPSELARYNYGVWLKHLISAHAKGLPCEPRTVYEIGPGDSIGAGLAALISGAESYVAIDGKWVWDTETNLAVFDALVALFRRREARGRDLDDRPTTTDAFPTHVLSDRRMARCLDPARLGRIRESISRVNRNDSCIRYIVQTNGDPMHELDGAADMIFSHAVLEHVGELPLVYERMSRWLAPHPRGGGVVSHEIDFRCHETARDWNGHWAYSDPVWKFLYLRFGAEPVINRIPCSEHLRLLRLHGFDLVTERRRRDVSGLTRPMLAPRFRSMSADDIVTLGVLVQAVKPR